MFAALLYGVWLGLLLIGAAFSLDSPLLLPAFLAGMILEAVRMLTRAASD